VVTVADLREAVRAALLTDRRALWLDPEDADAMANDVVAALADAMANNLGMEALYVLVPVDLRRLSEPDLPERLYDATRSAIENALERRRAEL
jgi:hypothetical protein